MSETADLIGTLHDLTLERDVLGQVLLFGLVQEYADAGLCDEHFFREEHRMVWQAAQQVYEAGGTADLVTVGQRLRSNDHFERVTAVYFSRLVDTMPRPSLTDMVLAVQSLEELTAGRLVHYATIEVNRALERPGAVADGALAQHLDTVQQVLERQTHTRQQAWFDVNQQLVCHERDVQAAATGFRLALGLEALDGTIGGIRAGEVLGLLGRPGIGKTVLLAHLATTAAQAGIGQVFFSLEMPASQIVGRFKQMAFGVGRYQLEGDTLAGRVDEGLYRRLYDRLVLVDTPGLSVSEMQRRVRQITTRGPLKDTPVGLIVIDHLGLIGGDRKLATYDRVSVQAREIKELAKRLGCAVVLAVQVNRDAGGDGSRELGLGAARDSGVVEEAMDYMVGIRRIDRSLTLAPYEREKFKDVIFAKVIKNRHGAPADREIAYRFFPVGLRLEEDRQLSADGEDVAARIAQTAARGGRR